MFEFRMSKFNKFFNFMSCLCILWNFCLGVDVKPTIIEPPNSTICLSCMCAIISNCNRTIGCAENICGMFQIDSLYWTNGGKHTVNGKTSSKLDRDFVNCSNDEKCARKTVIGYLTNFSEDCNEDGVIDCQDHAAAHLYSNKRSCKQNLPKDFREQLDDCVSELKGVKGTTPKTSPKSAFDIVNEKCEEYIEFVRGSIRPKLECDRFTALQNYTEFEPKQVPYMAAIGYGGTSDISWTCDGVLISEKFILTGAACNRQKKKNIPARWVHFGGSEYDISIKNEGTKLDIYEIIARILHPEYDTSTTPNRNNIALFKLNRKVKFNEFVRPVCLSTTFVKQASYPKALTIGWANTTSSKKKNYLPVVVPILPFSECTAVYGDSNDYFSNGSLSSKKLTCVGNSAVDRGSCVEIFGSALVHVKKEEPCMWEHLGIPTFGLFPCPKSGTLPFLYTSTFSHINWIQSIVWPQE